MAVSEVEFQKVRVCICVWVGGVIEFGRGVVVAADTSRKERVVISRRCHAPRRKLVAMRGALDLAARIMSCEKLPKPPLACQIRRSRPQYLASGPSLYCFAYESRCRGLRFVRWLRVDAEGAADELRCDCV